MRDLSVSGKLAKLPRAEQWADRICTQLGKSVESIIEVGHLLVQAKADLVHGEWGRLFELIPMSQNTAERHMRIANRLSNSCDCRNLPSSVDTLYELTKVEPKRLTAAFKDGLITPDMPRKAVKALLPQATARQESTTSTATKNRSTHGSHLEQSLSELRVWMAKWAHLTALAPIFDAATRLSEEVRRNEHADRGPQALEDDPEAGAA